MRICIIGKFPPIQGGVSMRTYRTAHALAARGHEVHVVTNAKEALPPFRMLMRSDDWARCEVRSGSGSVRVHWTDLVDRSQAYLPMASPFVSKLAGIAARVHAAHPFDVIFSHYMEPYGVAGHLASQMTGAPHVVRMAGSDAGRLWHHQQLEALYDHVLRSAHFVVAAGAVADRALERGIDPQRIVPGGGYAFHDDFTPEGPNIDFAALRSELAQEPELADSWWGSVAPDKPYFGIYGKLGDTKGSFALLAALDLLKRQDLDIGLVALAHGRPELENRFRDRVRELGLTGRVLQIPFLPHWRVPEFLRACLAVCCLEQDFPIGFHSPVTPLEVLLCGACLVGSTEVIRKLPQWHRLPHGYGCVAINDVNDIEEVSGKLAAIARRPALVRSVGARGRAFAQSILQDHEFPERLEHILIAASERRMLPSASWDVTASDVQPGAVAAEIVSAQSEMESMPAGEVSADPLFRMKIGEWALEQGKLGRLAPVRQCPLRILQFEHDIPELLGGHDVSELRGAKVVTEARGETGPACVVMFDGEPSRKPFLVDQFTARILELSDGTRTGKDIVRQLGREFGAAASLAHLAWIENLFVSGLIGLRDPPAVRATTAPGVAV